ncbi:DgyrCDS881 [Dimorphilus gyrociliatus]|uniref:DgyrCDS881 n=1 Tax=Dimorphilus gyrociliatus TaxID=2664684 RepID=A0A7I8V749_9ANNE|nr:DgyrCDS881 [Dimorphilus gyrociliatus]
MDAGPDGSSLERSTSWQSGRISALATPPRSRSDNLQKNNANNTDKYLIGRPEADVIFVNELEKQYECVACNKVLRYAVQFKACEHRCCSACLPQLMKVEPRCPIDQIKIEKQNIRVDKTFQKEVDALEILCSFKEKGCEWAGYLGELNVHLSDCLYRVIKCPMGCEVDLEKRFVDKHVEEDCVKRLVPCEYCHENFIYEEEELHLEDCQKFPIECPNKCGISKIAKDEVKVHLEEECPRQLTDCLFVRAGCEYKCERNEMDIHMKENFKDHLKMAIRNITANDKSLRIFSKSLQAQNERVNVVEEQVVGLEKLYGSQLLWKIDKHSEKMAEAKSGKKPTIYSPTFLTNRHGYRLALSSSLYGDGKARGQTMSLYVSICKGEYDALLKWPFTHKITFTLIDQCENLNERKNIDYTIKPNLCKENLSFLSKPIGDRNASFGAQKFIELDVLKTRDYTKNDCLYIKVAVDSEDMPLL